MFVCLLLSVAHVCMLIRSERNRFKANLHRCAMGAYLYSILLRRFIILEMPKITSLTLRQSHCISVGALRPKSNQNWNNLMIWSDLRFHWIGLEFNSNPSRLWNLFRLIRRTKRYISHESWPMMIYQDKIHTNFLQAIRNRLMAMRDFSDTSNKLLIHFIKR